MKTIFKKVGNNQFKLNEIDYFMRNELKLTKVEELEALNILKKYLIPKCVQYWNSYYERYHTTNIILNVNTIIHNLKKIGRDHNAAYYTSYDGDINFDKVPFKIVKELVDIDDDGEDLDQPYIRTLLSYYRIDDGYRTYTYDYTSNSKIKFTTIRENTGSGFDELKISKLEEAEALNFLRKVVIPKWVEYVKMYHITGHEYITSELVNQNLKKIVDKKSVKKFFSKYIKDEDDPRGVKGNYFQIDKVFDENQRPRITVSYYTSGDDFYVEFDLNTGEKLNESNKNLTVDKRRKISKIEEQEALNFIKKVVVPKLVQSWNDIAPNRRFEWTDVVFPNINVNDVLLTLKKISHDKFENPTNIRGSDFITYEADPIKDHGVHRIKVIFYIVKRSHNQGASYEIHVGYHDPFDPYDRDFRVGGIYL